MLSGKGAPSPLPTARKLRHPARAAKTKNKPRAKAPARWSATFRLYQSRRFAPIVARPLEANGQTNSIQIRLHLQEGAGASARSGDRPFELDLASEAVTIAPDRQNRQLAAAMPVSHGAVLRLESAVYVD